MKNILAIAILVLLLTSNAIAKLYQADSFKAAPKNTTSDSSKALSLISLSQKCYLEKPDSGLIYANQALSISRKSGFKKGQMRALTQVGFSLWLLGDPSAALQAFIQSNHLAEKLNDQWTIARNYDGMSCSNSEQGELKQALNYANISVALFTKLRDYVNVVNVLNDVSFGYQSIGKTDEALIYANRAYQLSVKINDQLWRPLVLGNIGQLYGRLNKDDLAIHYLHQSLQFDESRGMASQMIFAYNALGDIFFKQKQRDSAIYYYKKGFDMAMHKSILQNALLSSTMLAKLNNGVDNNQAVKYYVSSIALKDSLFNREKAKNFVLITITEQRHKEELVEEAKKVQEERKENLQLSAIALFIPLFLTFALLLSRTKTHRRVIEFMSVIGLLLLFEFITLLIHPWIEQITGHIPILELLILVCLAAFLVPLHHKSTHWLKDKLIHSHIIEAAAQEGTYGDSDKSELAEG